MDNYKLDLLNIKKIKLEGIATGTTSSEYINLYKLHKEIMKTKKIRNILVKTFEDDCNLAIHNLNIDYLNKVPFPMIIGYLNFISDGIIKVSLLSEERRGVICLFNQNGVFNIEKETTEVLEMLEVIKPYINGLFRVLKEDNFLDSSFYKELVITLYNKYIDKLIINGEGVKLSNYNLSGVERLELERIYYKNLKSILKNISIVNSLEIEKYKTNKSKEKILEIYRG